MNNEIRHIGFTLLIGFGGALLALYFGVPAAALLGSTFAVSLGSILKLPMKMPVILRNFAFTTIGCSLGTGITPDVIDNAAKWPLSLLVLGVLLLIIIYCSSWILVRLFGHSTQTAILSTSPGALSYSLALADQGIGNRQTISILQSVRLLMITLCLPLILVGLGEHGSYSEGTSVVWLGLGESFVLMGAVYFFGFMGDKFKIPAAFILIGLLISGILHATGFLVGEMPPEILFIGFALTGSVVGARFAIISLDELKKLLSAAVLVVVAGSAISAILAYGMASFFILPFGQVWVAYAPGGVEAMAAMALSLDYDPAFVATHHIFRIVFLILSLPLILKFVQQQGK